MQQRPRLLFLCQTLPFPPDSGVNIRAFHLLRLLSKDFDVTGLFFFRRAYRSTEAKVTEGRAGLGALASTKAFRIPQEWSQVRRVTDHVRSLVGGGVYTRFAYESAEFREALEQALHLTRFDVAHVDSLDLSAYLPLLLKHRLPIVCGHHNVESALLRRRAAKASSRMRRAYLLLQARAYAREEQQWMPQMALNLAVSAEDAADFRSRIRGASVQVVPSGVDTDGFGTSSVSDAGGADGVVFVGGLDWLPNRDALEYYASEILPVLRGRADAMRSVFVGRASKSDQERFEPLGLQLPGHVPSIEPYLSQAGCFIVPLRIGGGTRLKILDAWAMGKAVVSTSVGCEGLRAIDGENILIRDSPAAFADAVLQVLNDPPLRFRLGRAGRAVVEQHYSWERIGDVVRPLYRDVAGRTKSG